MLLKIKPKMRDVLEKMRECGKDVKMRDFPHDCGMVDTYENATLKLFCNVKLTPDKGLELLTLR